MRLTVLGSGTSQGIPIVGCECKVCKSSDARDKRLRCAIHIETDTTSLLIDAGPDIRYQMLRAEINHVDGVFITHEHIDHVNGLDDLRPLIFRSQKPMALYSTPHVLNQVRERFAYAFKENPYPGAPKFDLHAVGINERFRVGDLSVQSFQVDHGRLPVAAVRIGGMAYVTDVKSIPKSSEKYLHDLDILILDCLRLREHYSHLSLEESLDIVARFQPKQCYLTHVSHELPPFGEMSDRLPAGVDMAYDGLTLHL